MPDGGVGETCAETWMAWALALYVIVTSLVVVVVGVGGCPPVDRHVEDEAADAERIRRAGGRVAVVDDRVAGPRDRIATDLTKKGLPFTDCSITPLDGTAVRSSPNGGLGFDSVTLPLAGQVTLTARASGTATSARATASSATALQRSGRIAA